MKLAQYNKYLVNTVGTESLGPGLLRNFHIKIHVS